MSPVIQCHHLAKTYRDGDLSVKVFDNINLSVMLGETVAMTGDGMIRGACNIYICIYMYLRSF